MWILFSSHMKYVHMFNFCSIIALRANIINSQHIQHKRFIRFSAIFFMKGTQGIAIELVYSFKVPQVNNNTSKEGLQNWARSATSITMSSIVLGGPPSGDLRHVMMMSWGKRSDFQSWYDMIVWVRACFVGDFSMKCRFNVKLTMLCQHYKSKTFSFRWIVTLEAVYNWDAKRTYLKFT